VILQKVLGYKKKVAIIKKVAGGYKIKYDWGRYKKTKMGTRSFELWKNNIKLPVPPPDAVIGGVTHLFASDKGTFNYVKFQPKKSEFEIIDMDMTHWSEQEIKEGLNKYQDDSFLAKYAPYIMMGIFGFVMAICVVVYFQQVIFPMIEKASAIGSTTCICDVGSALANPPPAPPV